MIFEKQIRLEDDELRKFIRKLPCFACLCKLERFSATDWENFNWILENEDVAPDLSDPDHVSTRGAGNDDVPENLWPLCREHHDEKGDQGVGFMIERYPILKHWLEAAGRTDIFDRVGRSGLNRKDAESTEQETPAWQHGKRSRKNNQPGKKQPDREITTKSRRSSKPR